MHRKVAGPESVIDWGAAMLTLPGQSEPGDRHIVKSFPSGVMIAVVDGLGHGGAAAHAAGVAVATLESHAGEQVVSLVSRCHRALLRTRGAVMSLASITSLDGILTWLGVGNVEAVLLHADVGGSAGREWLSPRAGVVGYQLPPLHPSVRPVARGDTLVFVTDGIRSNFAEGLSLDAPPQRMADQILARFGKGTDDALVLVARYLGGTV